MSAVTHLREDDRPAGNFRRVHAGETLTTAEILSAWQRIVKIVLPVHGASAEPAVIELPPASRWPRPELTILDTTGLGYVLRLSAGDEIYGAAEGFVQQVVLRLTPALTDRHGEADAWAAA